MLFLFYASSLCIRWMVLREPPAVECPSTCVIFRSISETENQSSTSTVLTRRWQPVFLESWAAAVRLGRTRFGRWVLRSPKKARFTANIRLWISLMILLSTVFNDYYPFSHPDFIELIPKSHWARNVSASKFFEIMSAITLTISARQGNRNRNKNNKIPK